MGIVISSVPRWGSIDGTVWILGTSPWSRLRLYCAVTLAAGVQYSGKAIVSGCGTYIRQ